MAMRVVAQEERKNNTIGPCKVVGIRYVLVRWYYVKGSSNPVRLSSSPGRKKWGRLMSRLFGQTILFETEE